MVLRFDCKSKVRGSIPPNPLNNKGLHGREG